MPPIITRNEPIRFRAIIASDASGNVAANAELLQIFRDGIGGSTYTGGLACTEEEQTFGNALTPQTQAFLLEAAEISIRKVGATAITEGERAELASNLHMTLELGQNRKYPLGTVGEYRSRRDTGIETAPKSFDVVDDTGRELPGIEVGKGSPIKLVVKLPRALAGLGTSIAYVVDGLIHNTRFEDVRDARR
jgi:hypothetical protein